METSSHWQSPFATKVNEAIRELLENKHLYQSTIKVHELTPIHFAR
jgi:hypothetical protein